MKELIQKRLQQEPKAEHKRFLVAEGLQHLILQSLYRHHAFKNLAFTGGTALRILYETKRFSEDLDFSLVHPEGFHFDSLLTGVKRDLESQQFKVDMVSNSEKTVAQAELRFQGLLKEFGLSNHAEQKLMLKCKIDKNPPHGGKTEMVLVTTPLSYTVNAFDLSSLFATKLHAIFYRRYTKGRDYYDLFWYLGKKIKPNFPLLNNAIAQTRGEIFVRLTEENFKEQLLKHLESVDFKKVRHDVERFLLDSREIEFLNLSPIQSLLRHY